jgi:hypothetical protein
LICDEIDVKPKLLAVGERVDTAELEHAAIGKGMT